MTIVFSRPFACGLGFSRMPTYPRLLRCSLCVAAVSCFLLALAPELATRFVAAAQLVQMFALAGLILSAPWLQLRLWLPSTVGKFIRSAWFVTAWRAIGKPADQRLNIFGRRHNLEDAHDPQLVEFRYAGALQRHLVVTLILYAVLAVVNAIIVLAVFGGGITIAEL